jgi:outer membrane protein insertion porin family
MQATLLLWTLFAQAPVEHAVVAEVLIQGSEATAAATVKSYLKTRPGLDYDSDIVQEDVRTLVAAKLFTDVRAQVENLSHGRVNVYFLLRDPVKTIRRIEYRGAKHLHDDELNTITGLAVGAPLHPATNKIACEAIIRKLNDMGRPFADCWLLKGNKADDSEVVFVITEGPKYQISEIRFTGNAFVSSAVLETHIRSSPKIIGLFGGDFNKELLDDDLHKLVDYYRSFGFMDVRISSEVQYQPDGCHAVVTFHINEGVRYRIKDVPAIVGTKKIPPRRELEEVLKVTAGDYYDGRKLKRGADEIHDWYGWQGFEVRVEVLNVFSPEEPGIVRVQYEIDHQRQATP